VWRRFAVVVSSLPSSVFTRAEGRWIDLANDAPDFIHARLRQVVVSIGVRPVSNS
jgi:hypothetical protein